MPSTYKDFCLHLLSVLENSMLKMAETESEGENSR